MIQYGFKTFRPENMVVFVAESPRDKRARMWRTVKYYAVRIPLLLMLLIAIATVCWFVGAPAYIAGILGFIAAVRVFS